MSIGSLSNIAQRTNEAFKPAYRVFLYRINAAEMINCRKGMRCVKNTMRLTRRFSLISLWCKDFVFIWTYCFAFVKRAMCVNNFDIWTGIWGSIGFRFTVEATCQDNMPPPDRPTCMAMPGGEGPHWWASCLHLCTLSLTNGACTCWTCCCWWAHDVGEDGQTAPPVGRGLCSTQEPGKLGWVTPNLPRSVGSIPTLNPVAACMIPWVLRFFSHLEKIIEY